MKSSSDDPTFSKIEHKSPDTSLRRRGYMQTSQIMVPKAQDTSSTLQRYEVSAAYHRKTDSKEPLSSDNTYANESKMYDAVGTLNDRDGTKFSGENFQAGSDISDDFSVQISHNGTARTSNKFHNIEMDELNITADIDADDTTELIPGRKRRPKDPPDESSDISDNKVETSCTLALQISFPFLMAGMGMVAAGLVLDKVQHWEVFDKVSEVFILVPALLGLKGNLEMTLASRMSTFAHLGYLDDRRKKWSIIRGNMVLVEAQAMVVALLASLVAMILGWIPDGKWETNHALILCAGSLLTGAIASGILGAIMIIVIILSRKCGVNPDNIATPIAASLGDLTTLSLLSGIAQGLYNMLQQPHLVWVVWLIIISFVLLTPVLLFFAYRNEFTRDVIKNGWFPILSAMGISSLGGFILDFAVSNNPGVAVFAPVINGVGGNFAAVQASRLSTYLHRSKYPLGTLPPPKACDCVTPCFLYCGKGNPHARSARVMTMLAIPGQLVFLLTIQFLQAGHTTISPQFVAVYLTVSLIQVTTLLFVCNSLVHQLWRRGEDPDNCAIPYLTALGDLLGTGLLALGFLFLWSIGDRDQDVGD